MRNHVARSSSLVFVTVLAALAACDQPKTDPAKTNPTPVPETSAQPETRSANITPPGTSTTKTKEPKNALDSADADMKKVLVELGALAATPIQQLDPAAARKSPSIGDAAKKVLEKDGKTFTPIEMAKVEDKKIGGGPTPIAARIYTPKTDVKGPLPVVAYWHGGGFVIADLDTYDASARALAKESKAIVVSLDYRHAPEAKFPAAHDDAFTGYQWVLKNAASFGGDPKRVAVAGESAGGNLAANVSIMARDKNIQMPLHQVLVYPVAQTSMSTDSYKEWDFAKPLDKGMMAWFVDKYTRTPDDTKDPRISLVDAKLDKLPKTTIILAEIDPLRSDGDMFAKKLEGAGVDVAKKTYEGVTHEFFGLGAVVADAKDAESYAGGRLEDSLKK